MKLSRYARLTGVAVVGVLALAACGTDTNTGTTPQAGGTSPAAGGGCATGSISGAGSTFQQPMQQQWISQYAGRCSGAQVNYQGVGSGAGIQQFAAGTIDFGGSDVLMKADQQSKADARCGGQAIHIPVSAGGVAVTYNLDGVSKLQLSAGSIAGIFSGAIKQWDDAKIKADNPGVTLPSTPITVYYRSDASGTTQVFTEYMTATAKDTWTAGSGTTVKWAAGQGAKGSDGVVAGVKQTKVGVTYTEQSYALQNKLPTALVQNAGSYVALDAKTVSTALDSIKFVGSGNDLKAQINYTPSSPQAYPISTVTYVIVCTKYADAAKGKLVKSFLQYAVGDGQQFATKLGYAPLPGAVAGKVKAAVDSIS